MPKFRGRVTVTGCITVEGDDSGDADQKAQYLSAEDVVDLMLEESHYMDVEVFEDKFPEEV